MDLFDDEKENSRIAAINFARLLFLALIVFELLNYFKILIYNLEYTWLGLIITSVFSFTVLEVVAYKYKKLKGEHLHWSIWFIVAAGLSLDAFGDFFHFYGNYFWWDRVVHYFVSLVAVFTLFTVISAFWIDKFKYGLLFETGRINLSLYLASVTTMALSGIYEIEEYAEDLIFHTHRVGPGFDTSDDLLMNFFGILTAVAVIYLYYFIVKKRNILD